MKISCYQNTELQNIKTHKLRHLEVDRYELRQCNKSLNLSKDVTDMLISWI
jgi:predicted secreted Zn-dependent protease